MAEDTGEQVPKAYFDTPERAERLQLVAHVIRNTEATPYVRGPEGAGKSRFAERLAAIFKQETALVSLAGGAVADVPQAVCDTLGIPLDRWPAAAVDAAPEDGLLVLVDDVDRLTISALEALEELREVGAKLLFLGESDPVALSIGWELQLIDLPPLTEAQLKEFLAFLGRDEAQQLKGSALSKLLRNSQGLPGRVLEILAEGGVPSQPVKSGNAIKLGRWLGVGAIVVVVAAVIWQQDRINALFEPPPTTEPPMVSQAESPAGAPERVEAEEQSMAGRPDAAMAPVVPPPTMPEPMPDVIEPQPAAEVAVEPPPEAVPMAPEPGTLAPAAEVKAKGVTWAQSPKPSPSAVETIEKPEPQFEAPAIVEVAPAPEVESEVEPEPGTLAWLRSRDPRAHTLQLVGARDRGAIDKFIAQHRLTGGYAVYERDLGGKPWYSLVYGEYADIAAAKRARGKLPRALRSAWPRSFDSVIKQLPPE